MSILRISDYTRPAAERWRGGIVFGGGRRRSRPAPTSFAPTETAGDGSRAPSRDGLRADGGPAEEGGRAGEGAVMGWGILENML